MQSQQSDFRRTVHADWKVHCAQPGIGVQRKLADLVRPPNIFLGQWRQEKRVDEGQSHLASVGVARELEVHCITRNSVGIVGLVGQEDHRFVRGDVLESCVEIGGAA